MCVSTHPNLCVWRLGADDGPMIPSSMALRSKHLINWAISLASYILLSCLSLNLELDASKPTGPICSCSSPSARLRNTSGCGWLFPGHWESKVTWHTDLQKIRTFFVLKSNGLCHEKALMLRDRTGKGALSTCPALVFFGGSAVILTWAPLEPCHLTTRDFTQPQDLLARCWQWLHQEVVKISRAVYLKYLEYNSYLMDNPPPGQPRNKAAALRTTRNCVIFRPQKYPGPQMDRLLELKASGSDSWVGVAWCLGILLTHMCLDLKT